MNSITPGINDDLFIRDKVPMTKEEIRVISICKMHLDSDSVVFDIGSGTGSVAVEIGKLSEQIKVIAFEDNPVAVELIKNNTQKFNCSNIYVINGSAPEAFENCKDVLQNAVPTHAFIGGTKGKLSQILKSLYELNPKMRIVINAVTLESICQINEILKLYSVTESEVIQVSVNKAKEMGSHHLMQANNPVFIFSFNFLNSAK